MERRFLHPIVSQYRRSSDAAASGLGAPSLAAGSSQVATHPPPGGSDSPGTRIQKLGEIARIREREHWTEDELRHKTREQWAQEEEDFRERVRKEEESHKLRSDQQWAEWNRNQRRLREQSDLLKGDEDHARMVKEQLKNDEDRIRAAKLRNTQLEQEQKDLQAKVAEEKKRFLQGQASVDRLRNEESRLLADIKRVKEQRQAELARLEEERVEANRIQEERTAALRALGDRARTADHSWRVNAKDADDWEREAARADEERLSVVERDGSASLGAVALWRCLSNVS